MMNRPSVPDALTAELSRLISEGLFHWCVTGWVEQCRTACSCCGRHSAALFGGHPATDYEGDEFFQQC